MFAWYYFLFSSWKTSFDCVFFKDKRKFDLIKLHCNNLNYIKCLEFVKIRQKKSHLCIINLTDVHTNICSCKVASLLKKRQHTLVNGNRTTMAVTINQRILIPSLLIRTYAASAYHLTHCLVQHLDENPSPPSASQSFIQWLRVRRCK